MTGDLDAADEALLGQLSGLARRCRTGDRTDRDVQGRRTTDPADDGRTADGDEMTYSLAELAEATGMPLALMKAIEAEGLLIPTRVAGRERYTDEDVAASRAGLLLLEWGIPLSDLLDLARRHNEAAEEVARRPSTCSPATSRDPLRHGARPDALAHAAGTPSTPPAIRPSTASCRPTPSCSRL